MNMNHEINNDDEVSQNKGYFPFEYFIDFLKFLRENDDVIEIITYDDLLWGDDYDYVHHYPQEHNNWKDQLKKGIRDDQKIYVLLQHDVDSAPERTMAILRKEERFRIPSNVMIFNRRINRRHMQKTGELIYTEYAVDYNYLRRLQNESRFVIAYHSNAFDQALFNKERALRIFEDDVKALREHFNILYFSPHGGVHSPTGLVNHDLPMPESLKSSLRWVHNRNNVRFDGEFSDGGINSPKRDPAKRDLRDFVRKWEKGKRYRILIHPQYYNAPCSPSPRMAGTSWYDDLLGFYASKKQGTAWDEVQLITDREHSNDNTRSRFSFIDIIRRYCVRK